MKNQRLSIWACRGIPGALPWRIRQKPGLVNSERTMKKVRETPEQEGPLGIIISRGDRSEDRPVFAAYIWGPAPEPVAEPKTKVA